MIQPSPDSTVAYQPSLDQEYDVVVIGGGPAGSSTAALVAEYGHRVLLLERAAVPRFHVGESLIPETYWPLKRLGLINRLKESAFPRKFSVQFVSDGHKESAPFYFDNYNPHESSVTWQVVRSEFDKMLLDRAVELGAVVHTSAHVQQVLFDGDAAVGVGCTVTNPDGVKQDLTIKSKVVVDASGQSAFLSSRHGKRDRDPRLRKATVWSYFRGARRDDGRDEGATLIMQTEMKKSWFWYIPLPNNVVSVGCTGSLNYMFGDTRDPAKAFQRELERCPAMQERLRDAERCEDFFTTRDFSYYAREGAGKGWLLVGDAFGFIDPVYSSGVYLALKGGEFAADAIHDALQREDLSGPRLGQWQPLYKQGLENFRKLVYAFYTPGFSFGTFLKEHPQFKSNMVDILVGDVFKPGVGDIFDAMGTVEPPLEAPACDQPETAIAMA
ncbi:MAG: tryptophan 7-halogenase [Planctomycetaceae bacterium]|nr:tryptophan 7-halogenase [Planctomycetaceae bacterium]